MNANEMILVTLLPAARGSFFAYIVKKSSREEIDAFGRDMTV
jgi:hypothetical protein